MWLYEKILEYAFWVFSEKKTAKQQNRKERKYITVCFQTAELVCIAGVFSTDLA